MPSEALPDELVNRMIIELHLSVVADKAFYVSRQQERRKAGIQWTHDHLIPVSVVNNQFRRVCLPVLFESADIIAQSYDGEDEKQFRTYVEQFVKFASLRSHVSTAVRCV
jgi:hypothetical protein